MAMASKYALAKSGAQPLPLLNLGVHDFSASTNGLDSLETILGDLDYCACTHCRSVFSPAAYLADLLKFLDDRGAETPYADALAVLRDRRPDIEHILLDCDNTNVVMPQIDLAIELLERKFADTLDGSSPQTTWSADQLANHPEHAESGVYDDTLPNPGTKLGEHVHPWVLPFSLPILESRTYLGHMQTERAELMALLDDGADPSAEDVAAESLGLTPAQWRIISGTWTGNASTDDREFYGFADGAGTDDWVDRLDGTHTTKALADARELLRRGGYELDELRELLTLEFIDPENFTQSAIAFTWSETCSLSDARIENVTATVLDRLHRFTRLQRAVDISSRDLGLLIQHVGGGTLDETFMLELPKILALQERTGLEMAELATWWSDEIDARNHEFGGPSLYQRRFLAPELQASSDFAPSDDEGHSLSGDDGIALTDSERAVVLAGTRLSVDDYDALLTAPGENWFTSADKGEFRFVFFAQLMRASSFMRGLGLTATEVVALASCLEDIAIDPFADPSRTADIVAIIDQIRASGLSIEKTAWLLRHDFDDRCGYDEAEVARVFTDLVRAHRTIADEVRQLVDPTGEATETNLGSVITVSADLTDAMEILANTTTTLSTAEQQQFIDDHFASFVDATEAKNALVGPHATYLGGEESDAPARYAYILRAFLLASRRRTLVVDTVAAKLEVPTAGRFRARLRRAHGSLWIGGARRRSRGRLRQRSRDRDWARRHVPPQRVQGVAQVDEGRDHRPSRRHRPRSDRVVLGPQRLGRPRRPPPRDRRPEGQPLELVDPAEGPRRARAVLDRRRSRSPGGCGQRVGGPRRPRRGHELEHQRAGDLARRQPPRLVHARDFG